MKTDCRPTTDNRRPTTAARTLCRLLLSVVCCLSSFPVAAQVATLQWDVETSRPASYKLELYRGETVNLEPRFLSYATALSITNATNVVFRYRDDGLTAGTYYATNGAVLSTSTGRVRVVWAPACEGTSNAYDYAFSVESTDGRILRAFGEIKLIDTVSGVPTSNPSVVSWIDWATVEQDNIASAPFATTATVSVLQVEYAETSNEVSVLTGGLAGVSNQAATAYGWGDHAAAGYLTNYSETDPLWAAVSNTITSGAALGASALQAESDPLWAAVSNTVTTQAGQGAAAYAWAATNGPYSDTWTNALGAGAWIGRHDTNGYLTTYAETDPNALLASGARAFGGTMDANTSGITNLAYIGPSSAGLGIRYRVNNAVSAISIGSDDTAQFFGTNGSPFASWHTSAFLPATSNAYDLGSSAFPWRSLYVSTNSVHLGTVRLTADPSAGDLTLSAPAGTNRIANEDWVDGRYAGASNLAYQAYTWASTQVVAAAYDDSWTNALGSAAWLALDNEWVAGESNATPVSSAWYQSRNADRVRVRAYGTADQLNLTQNADNILQFNAESVDTHNAYVTTNYTFTVPAGHSGRYAIVMGLYISSWVANTRGYVVIANQAGDLQANTTYLVGVLSWVTQLAEGATAIPKIHVNTGTTTADVLFNTYGSGVVFLEIVEL